MGEDMTTRAEARAVTTVIDPELCTGCGRCVGVCPSDTLTLVDGKARVTGAESLNCGHCEAACPEGAIHVGGASTATEDALLAAENILLAAHALGYGTCLIGFAVAAMHANPRLQAGMPVP